MSADISSFVERKKTIRNREATARAFHQTMAGSVPIDLVEREQAHVERQVGLRGGGHAAPFLAVDLTVHDVAQARQSVCVSAPAPSSGAGHPVQRPRRRSRCRAFRRGPPFLLGAVRGGHLPISSRCSSIMIARPTSEGSYAQK